MASAGNHDFCSVTVYLSHSFPSLQSFWANEYVKTCAICRRAVLLSPQYFSFVHSHYILLKHYGLFIQWLLVHSKDLGSILSCYLEKIGLSGYI